MRRRGFLAGAAALALAALGRRALGDVSLRAPAETALDAAIRRARTSGRPLVVLVIPRGYAETLERGHAFGEWLTHGSDADLAPLALCELVCAPSVEVERAFATSPLAEPLVVFAEFDRGAARAQQLLERLPEVPWLCLWCTDQTESKRAADRAIDQRIALLGGWVRARVRGRDAGAVAEAAADVRAALRERAPAGSRWAYAEQFGSARLGVEPPPEGGMEMIAKRTQRVLYLFDD
jgi:hypothetical protein